MIRKRIEGQLGEPFIIEVEGEKFSYPDCVRIGEIATPRANIDQVVLKTPDGRLIWVVCVGDDDVGGAYGILHGWYVADFITAETAMRLRKSWEVLREQPPFPRG